MLNNHLSITLFPFTLSLSLYHFVFFSFLSLYFSLSIVYVAINDRITELAALVPDDFSRDKQSKGQVLKTCVEYTQHLQAQNQQYRDEYERILRVNMLLEQRQRDFQNRISQLEQTIQELEHHIATLVLNEHRPNTANLAAPTTPSAAASDAATADPGNCSESDSSHVHAHSPYDHHKTPPDSREPEA